MNDLKGKNIIVTGASGGIGNSIVEKLNYACKKVFDDLHAEGDESYYYHYIFGYLDNVAYRNKPKLEELSEGAFRRAYSIDGEEWVLKLSMQTSVGSTGCSAPFSSQPTTLWSPLLYS